MMRPEGDIQEEISHARNERRRHDKASVERQTKRCERTRSSARTTQDGRATRLGGKKVY